MTHSMALPVLLGAGAGLGLLVSALALAGRVPAARPQRWRGRLSIRRWELPTTQLAGAVGAGVLVGALTRWPVAAILTALGALTLPRLLGPNRAHAAHVDRIEAVAGWAEMLRDTLSAAAGLEQAILATTATAPAPIRTEVTHLAARIERGQRLPEALRAFADELADPTADLVVSALVLASERQARELAALLGSLATAAREQATMRMRVAAGRARTHTSMRIVVGATVAMAGGLVLLNRDYLAPYDTATGQLVLLAVGGCFAAAFAWLARMTRLDRPARFLTALGSLGGHRAREEGTP